MLRKALTTAALLAATLAIPQAHAAPTLSATIVIESAWAIQVTHPAWHAHHPRHWDRRRHGSHAGYQRNVARHHAGRHGSWRHASSPRHHHPRHGGHDQRRH